MIIEKNATLEKKISSMNIPNQFITTKTKRQWFRVIYSQ